MIARVPSANVFKVNGAVALPGGGMGGPASTITYDVVVHLEEQDQIFADVRPSNRRYPDTVDTVAAEPNDPVGLCNSLGGGLLFIIPEMVRIDEECT